MTCLRRRIVTGIPNKVKESGKEDMKSRPAMAVMPRKDRFLLEDTEATANEHMKKNSARAPSILTMG
jgi:hypothetical protein